MFTLSLLLMSSAQADPLATLLADGAAVVTHINQVAAAELGPGDAPMADAMVSQLMSGGMDVDGIQHCLDSAAQATDIAAAGLIELNGATHTTLRCRVVFSDAAAGLGGLGAQRGDEAQSCGEGCLAWTAAPAMAARVHEGAVELVLVHGLEGEVAPLLTREAALRDTAALAAFRDNDGPLGMYVNMTAMPEYAIFEGERLIQEAVQYASDETRSTLWLAGQGVLGAAMALTDPRDLEFEDATLRLSTGGGMEVVATLTEWGLAVREGGLDGGSLPTWTGPAPGLTFDVGGDPLAPLSLASARAGDRDAQVLREELSACGAACTILTAAAPWTQAAQLVPGELPDAKVISAMRVVVYVEEGQPRIVLQLRGASKVATDALEERLPGLVREALPQLGQLPVELLRVGRKDLLLGVGVTPDASWSGKRARLAAGVSLDVSDPQLMSALRVSAGSGQAHMRTVQTHDAVIVTLGESSMPVPQGSAPPLAQPRDPAGQACLAELAALEPYERMANASPFSPSPGAEALEATLGQAERCRAIPDVAFIAAQRARVAHVAIAGEHASAGRFSQARASLDAACAMGEPQACERLAWTPEADLDLATLPTPSGAFYDPGFGVFTLRVDAQGARSADGSPCDEVCLSELSERSVLLLAPADLGAESVLNVTRALGGRAALAVAQAGQPRLLALRLVTAQEDVPVVYTVGAEGALEPTLTELPDGAEGAVGLPQGATVSELVHALHAIEALQSYSIGVRVE